MAWNSRYIPGNNWIVCDLCGHKIRASKARFNHDGLLVCTKDWEPQHPQEYMVEHRAEKIVPDKVRSEPTEIRIRVLSFPYSLPYTFQEDDVTVTYIDKITADDL